MNRSIALGIVFLVATAGSAFASVCDDSSNLATTGTISKVDANINDIQATINSLASADTKTAKLIVANLQEAIKTLQDNKQKAAASAGDAAHEVCQKSFATPQAAVDIGITLALGGLNLLIPARVWHIDVAEVLTGNPLGGPCSFFRNPLGHGC